jgi:hypothetical protein
MGWSFFDPWIVPPETCLLMNRSDVTRLRSDHSRDSNSRPSCNTRPPVVLQIMNDVAHLYLFIFILIILIYLHPKVSHNNTCSKTKNNFGNFDFISLIKDLQTSNQMRYKFRVFLCKGIFNTAYVSGGVVYQNPTMSFPLSAMLLDNFHK